MDGIQQKVLKATADDLKEPSSFVLKELAQISWNSERECAELYDLLLKRLDSATANVKYKTLRTFKYIVMNGRPDFRVELQRGNILIKNCLHYSGPLDPARGDAPNQKVRDEAKDLIAVVFGQGSGSGEARHVSTDRYGGGGYASREREPTYSAPQQSHMGQYPGQQAQQQQQQSSYPQQRRQYEGMSSADYAQQQQQQQQQPDYPPSGHSVPGYGDQPNNYPSTDWQNPVYSLPPDDGGRYGGMGNPNFENSRSRKIERPENFVQYDREEAYRRTQGYGQAVSHGGMGSGGAYGDPAHVHKRGQVGGGWGNESQSQQSNSQSYPPSSSGGGGAYGGSSSYGSGRSGYVSKSSGEYEGRLVDAITVPQGVRPIPTKEEITKFVSQCENLDKWLVASLLTVKLTDDFPWQTQMKGLCVLEALLELKYKDVEDCLCENISSIERFENSPNPQLKKKAIRILELLELREVEKPKATTTSAPSASINYQPAVIPGITPTNGHAGGNVVDMFGSLNINEPNKGQPAKAAAASTDLFSVLGNEQPKTSAAPGGAPAAPGGFSFTDGSSTDKGMKPSTSFDLFGTSTASTSSAAPSTATSAASKPAANSLDALYLDAATSSTSHKADPLATLMASAKGTAQRPPGPPGLPGAYPTPPFGQYSQPPQGYPGYPPGPPAGYGYPPGAAYPQYPQHPPSAAAPAANPYGAGSPFSPQAPVDFTVKAANPTHRGSLGSNSLLPPGPTAAPPGGAQSGFGFLGGGSNTGVPGQRGDSFGFVGDLMR